MIQLPPDNMERWGDNTPDPVLEKRCGTAIGCLIFAMIFAIACTLLFCAFGGGQ